MGISFGDYWVYKVTRFPDSYYIQSHIKCHRTKAHYFNNCDVNEEYIEREAAPAGWVHYCRQSPAGMREPVLQVTLLGGVQHLLSPGPGGQECVSNVHMNKCSTMTFPHVRQEGDLQSTQLDSPNWHFDLMHLHMSHSIAGSCMFHCVQLEVSPTRE